MTSDVGGRSVGSGVGITSFGTPVTGSGGGASVAGASATAEAAEDSIVQFMWQPLTEISYPRSPFLPRLRWVDRELLCC